MDGDPVWFIPVGGTTGGFLGPGGSFMDGDPVWFIPVGGTTGGFLGFGGGLTN